MKKKRSISVYADDKVTLKTTLTVRVDDTGDEWLTPEQVVYLENAYLWARYAYSPKLRASKRFIRNFVLPQALTCDTKESSADSSLIRATPAYNGATI